MKQILFNTEMVRAILDGRKTVTRRIAFPSRDLREVSDGWWFRGRGYKRWDDLEYDLKYRNFDNPFKYKKGDILYVRETWKRAVCDPAGGGYALSDMYLYKADEPIDTAGMNVEEKWHPSIHMPKEAARIFLRVTDVRVERLKDIDDDGVVAEGLEIGAPYDELWNSTIKKSDLDKYSWNANPWVWVIEFERISKEEATK